MRRDPHPSAEWGAAVAVLGMAVIGACIAVSTAYAGLIAFLGGL